MKGLFCVDPKYRDLVYSPSAMARIRRLVDCVAPPCSAAELAAQPVLLGEVEVLLTGWGAPVLDEALLAHAPKLRAVFYGAGSVKGMVTEAFWARGIGLCAAPVANAKPVAEFTLSQILFGLKLGWQHNRLCKRGFHDELPMPGALGSTVGLISLGVIARMVCKLLAAHDVKVVAYDPFLNGAAARDLGVELCSLDEVFRRSAVVSLHSPALPETAGMIGREHFEAMPAYASFINTARSSLVRHDDLIAVLRQRPDLWAVLDVIEDATEAQKCQLRELENVTLTPHIAGARTWECQRMGDLVADELERFAAGIPFQHSVIRADLERIA